MTQLYWTVQTANAIIGRPRHSYAAALKAAQAHNAEHGVTTWVFRSDQDAHLAVILGPDEARAILADCRITAEQMAVVKMMRAIENKGK